MQDGGVGGGGDRSEKFLGATNGAATSAIFGLKVSLKEYGALSDGPNYLSEDFQNKFQSWLLTVPFDAGDVGILSCPEDRKCEDCAPADKRLCAKCQVPLRKQCKNKLKRDPPLQPEAALTNDMWMGFASPIIAEQKVTVVEMICASACIVSLICFSMEVERGSVLQERAHMGYRVGARGNTTVFPLPLQELFAELTQCQEQEEEAGVPHLPRTGSELANIVKVIIKGSSQNSAKFITQAVVRRDVVVDLIMYAKKCGHRAYQFIDEAAVSARAEALPENGVPDEILHLLEKNDASIEKLQPQKSATPVPGRVSERSAFDGVRPNAVTDEKSGDQGGDVNSKSVSAIEALVTKLQAPVLEVGQDKKEHTLTTGNEMIDQFQPWYFGIAFPFCFNACVACPDLDRRDRYRRSEDAPRVNIGRWVETIMRRVEAQFKRDWSLTYSLWNLSFPNQGQFEQDGLCR